MKFLKAVLMGALLWVLIFFEVSILMFGFKLQGSVYYLVHYTLLAFLVIFVSVIYFRDQGVKRGLGEGLLLGIVILIAEIILDAIITVPLWIEEGYAFFNDVYLWVGYVVVVVIASVVGWGRG